MIAKAALHMEKTMTTNNMALWDAVSKTNPAHTKRVNQRGGFTAIAAHSQILEATRQFGPLGIGWGYDAGAPIFPPNGTIIVPVTIWHGDRQNSFGPWYGCANMGDNRVDTDAPKKAETDAITKGLSHLGFNADVFLGLFDDNKYIEAVKAEFSEPKEKRVELAGPYKSKSALWSEVRKFCHELHGCGDSDMLEAFLAGKDSKALLEQCKRDAPQLLEGGDKNLPEEYEPINHLIARLRTGFSPQGAMAAG